MSVRRLANLLERDKGAPNARHIGKAGLVADYDAYPLWTSHNVHRFSAPIFGTFLF